MCGIAGIFAYKPASSEIDRRALKTMTDAMTARGPDGRGEWVSADGRLGFGHRRLSILDLTEAGAQPMSDAQGHHVITFNGEIYNYRELRKALQSRGHVFQSQSDTEVLLHLYADKGADMVHDLRGMFAFAIWDARRRTLFLARDPYGIKPLYYCDVAGRLAFASTVKVLLTSGIPSRTPDAAGVVGFHLFGSVPEPYTTFRDIRAVPAGCSILVDTRGRAEPQRFASIAGTFRQAEEQARSVSATEVEDRFREAALDCVKHHLVADVEVGAFLSGGVDSCALVGLMRDAGMSRIRSITLTYTEFEGTPDDELPFAKLAARHFDTDHVTRRVGRQEFLDDLPRIMEAMDQPSIDGINAWFVSKAARELGLKVAISGVGGDELLGGYSTFSRLPRMVDTMRRLKWLENFDSALSSLIGMSRALGLKVHPKFAGLLRYGTSYAGGYLLMRGVYLPGEIEDLLGDRGFVADGLARLRPLDYIEQQSAPSPAGPFGKVAAMESCLYLRNQLLRDTDWAGMAHSLEVRTPLVDFSFLGQTAPLVMKSIECGANPLREGKRLLGKAPRCGLPERIVDRPKYGFSIPVKDWLPASWKPGGSAADNATFSRDWALAVAAAQKNAVAADAETASN